MREFIRTASLLLEKLDVIREVLEDHGFKCTVDVQDSCIIECSWSREGAQMDVQINFVEDLAWVFLWDRSNNNSDAISAGFFAGKDEGEGGWGVNAEDLPDSSILQPLVKQFHTNDFLKKLGHSAKDLDELVAREVIGMIATFFAKLPEEQSEDA